jgi:acyl carrier protein
MAKTIPDNLEQELKQVIANVIGREPEELKPETDFWKDLGVDSIKAIEITVAIERHFKIAVRDEEIPKITNFGQAMKVVKEALDKKNK